MSQLSGPLLYTRLLLKELAPLFESLILPLVCVCWYFMCMCVFFSKSIFQTERESKKTLERKHKIKNEVLLQIHCVYMSVRVHLLRQTVFIIPVCICVHVVYVYMC